MRFIKLLSYVLKFIRECDTIYIGNVSIWKKKDKKDNYWIGIRKNADGSITTSNKCQSALKAWEEIK